MQDLAIFAGRGILPEALAKRFPEALVVSFKGVGLDFEPSKHFEAQYEKSGALFRALNAQKVKKICFAGQMSRPELSLWRMDFKTVRMLPKLKAALAQSDGHTLFVIRQLVEVEGFEVVGAHELLPDWVASIGVLGNVNAPEIDSARAIEIHKSMSTLDIGQALVMHDELCLAVESLPGTKAMLEFVARHHENHGGYLFKSSKIGQDLDMDMASIGVETIAQVKEANLAGIVLGAERSLILDKRKTLEAADAAGIFVLGV